MITGSIAGTTPAGRVAADDEACGDGARFDAAMAAVTRAAEDAEEAARQAIVAFDLTRSATDPIAAAAYVAGARQVSVAQGLADGAVDFTRITPRQMLIAGGAMVATGRASAGSMAGVLDLAAQTSDRDTPVNFFAYLNQQAAANEQAPGGMGLAFGQRASVAVMTHVHRADGLPITYDDHYPTAPRPPSAEEINTRLKTAIESFRKEASLTPAQRMRREVLKSLNLTEDALKAMPEADREAAEKKIGEEIARRLALLGLTGGSAGEARADDPAGVAAAVAPEEDRAGH